MLSDTPTHRGAASSSPFSQRSPADGSLLSEVTATAPAEVVGVVARARVAQEAWAQRSVEDRVRAIAPVKRRILERAEQIALQVHAEVGKPDVEALLGEVLPSADVVDYWVRGVEELLEPTEIELESLSYPGKRGWVHREPRGVVALVTPYNFPFALPLRTIVPALLAGNAVVFKPSELAPRAGALLAAMFDDLLPPGLLTVVQGGADVGAALVESEVDVVVFTGSVAAGRKVAHACAERLVPCVLELGGKDAAIVLADANLERAANGVVWGAMMNAGQNCASIERVYVEKAIAPRFLDACARVIESLRPGVDVGPLATEERLRAVRRQVEEATNAGANVVSRGAEGAEPLEGFHPPTLLTVTSEELELMQNETFGPVLPVVVVNDVEEAIQRTNASRFGLTVSIWTKDVRRAGALASRLRAGTVTVNNHAFTGALPAAPWSGRGETGYGVTNSPLALDALTAPRFVLVDRGRGAREPWWFPYTPLLRKLALAMTVVKNGSRNVFARCLAAITVLLALGKRRKGM